jgi:hypothetical protein
MFNAGSTKSLTKGQQVLIRRIYFLAMKFQLLHHGFYCHVYNSLKSVFVMCLEVT